MILQFVLVLGELVGIGLEFCFCFIQQLCIDCWLFVFVDLDILWVVVVVFVLFLQFLFEDVIVCQLGDLLLCEVCNIILLCFGELDLVNVGVVIGVFFQVGQVCLDGCLDGVVIGLVYKVVINQGGIVYSGIIELLVGQVGVEVVMMFVNDIVCVVLVIMYLFLCVVVDVIIVEGLMVILYIVYVVLCCEFGIVMLCIVVFGLNLYVGEDGYLGCEELDLIILLLDWLWVQGMDLVGLLLVDIVFLLVRLIGFDIVLVMYYDQGLLVFKYSGFEQVVNIILGLFYLCVVVDYGIVLELVGWGIVDFFSLFVVMFLCVWLVC